MADTTFDVAVTSATIPSSSVWQAIVAEINPPTSGYPLHLPLDDSLNLQRDGIYHIQARIRIFDGSDYSEVVSFGLYFNDDLSDNSFVGYTMLNAPPLTLEAPCPVVFTKSPDDTVAFDVTATFDIWLGYVPASYLDINNDAPGSRLWMFIDITSIEGNATLDTTVCQPKIFILREAPAVPDEILTHLTASVSGVNQTEGLSVEYLAVKRPVRAGTPMPPPS